MNPEDRIRDAMAGRAAAARTSPDALDGVFTRVARRKRNTRLAAAGGTALSVVAVTAIAGAALRSPSGEVTPAAPTPSVAVTVGTPVPTPRPTAVARPKDRAFVVLKDHRLVEVSTSSGAVLRTVTRLPADTNEISVSPDHASVFFSDSCRVVRVDVASGARKDLGPGYAPALAPDGRHLAAADCTDDGVDGIPVVVTDLATGKRTTYGAKDPGPSPDGTMNMYVLSAPRELAWVDSHTVAVARVYEEQEELLLLDIDKNRWMNDATGTRTGVTHLAIARGAILGSDECCMPEFDKPTGLIQVVQGGEPRTLLQRRDGIRDLAVDDRNVVLFVSGGSLWSWNWQGQPRRLLANAVAVAA
jgi:hypothetical protein